MVKGIRYTAPVFDSSGYAEASRNYILALSKLGVQVTVNPVSFEMQRPDLGETGEMIRSLVNKPIDYDVNLIHTTPEFYEEHYVPGKVNIFYTIWETTGIHPSWPEWLNAMDAGMVGCQWNVEVFRRCGVRVPLVRQVHGIDPEDPPGSDAFTIEGINPSTFKFFSVFQWTERKNPEDLLKAYWSEFTQDDDVVLILKTYKNETSLRQQNEIKRIITYLKQDMPLDYYPPICFIGELLSRAEMRGLYRFGDCFVILERSEGFGLPHFEAALCGKPVISTDFGGTSEFLNNENAYRVRYTTTPVAHMPWSPWYRGNQMWAQPDVAHGMELMRHVYGNREEAKRKGELARKNILENFTWEKVGKQMIDNINHLVDRVVGTGGTQGIEVD